MVAALVESLGLGRDARGKVRRYYQQLELGQLEPKGVAASVWDALTALLGRDARVLAAIQPQAPAAAPMFREANVDYDRPLESASSTAAAAQDEVDRLFGVTSAD